MPSLLKNPLKMNHPSTNPEMKSNEYHLIDIGPMPKSSGFMLQCIANVSNMIFFVLTACKGNIILAPI